MGGKHQTCSERLRDSEFYIILSWWVHSHTFASKRLWRSRFYKDVLTVPPAWLLNLGDFLFERLKASWAHSQSRLLTSKLHQHQKASLWIQTAHTCCLWNRPPSATNGFLGNVFIPHKSLAVLLSTTRQFISRKKSFLSQQTRLAVLVSSLSWRYLGW